MVSNLRKNAFQSCEDCAAFLRRLHCILRTFENPYFITCRQWLFGFRIGNMKLTANKQETEEETGMRRRGCSEYEGDMLQVQHRTYGIKERSF